MDKEPKLPSPTIEPQDVAQAIVNAATRRTRDKKVGGGAKVNTMVSKLAPALADKLASKKVDQQHYDENPRHPDGALHQPSESTRVVGRVRGTGGREVEDT